MLLNSSIDNSIGGIKVKKFGRVGELCPNPNCPDFGKIQSEHQRNIKKNGKTSKGVQWGARPAGGHSRRPLGRSSTANAHQSTRLWKS